eukprot:6325215-Pyramimonas_sp.AAC.1
MGSPVRVPSVPVNSYSNIYEIAIIYLIWFMDLRHATHEYTAYKHSQRKLRQHDIYHGLYSKATASLVGPARCAY